MIQSRSLMNSFGVLAFLIAVEGVARAADLPVKAPASVPSANAADDSLTWNGITLYGIIDLGISNQTAGLRYNANFPTGVEELISKNGSRSVTGFTPNGLSQSQIGLKGDIPLGSSGFSAIFNFNAGFEPFALANGLQSLVNNNGKNTFPFAGENSNGDSSRAGQIFNGAAYAGFKSNTYGTLTFGRQNSIMLDDVLKYDPQGGSFAFSLIGFSGATAGMGDTQDARLDSSLKYTNKIGWFRVAALYQWAGQQNQFVFLPDGVSGRAAEFDVGVDLGGFSADLIYNYKQDAISAAPLSAAQFLVAPDKNSLAATVSNNTSFGAMAKYTAGPATLYGGFERITFANPSQGFSPAGSPSFGMPATDIGGYNLFYTATSVDPFPIHKILSVYWIGLKYFVTPKLSLTGAFYGITQNSFNVVQAGVNDTRSPCSNSSHGGCSGNEQVVSFVADYSFTKHFDVYAGSMWSEVHNGLASGFLHNSNLSTMAGARYTF
jgi:predicted porin